MSFPLTAAAAQVENFEALNEGMWVEPAAIQNIEATLAANAAATAESAALIATAEAAQATAEASLATANTTIAANNTRIAELEAQVATLEGEAPVITSTTKEADENGGALKVPFHLSAENPMNAIADSLPGMHRK